VGERGVAAGVLSLPELRVVFGTDAQVVLVAFPTASDGSVSAVEIFRYQLDQPSPLRLN
jgi:hypothetical protein